MALPIRDAFRRDVLRYESSERRVRTRLGGRVLADSRRPLLVWEPKRAVCVYAFPEEDVDLEALQPAVRPIDGAHGGSATFYDTGEVRNSAWRYADSDLSGYVCFVWEDMDGWWEEEDEIIGHARDPYHRVDLRHSTRHVRVELNGVLVADSHHPALVFETTLPTRYYLPQEDVDMAQLVPTETETICAYKGERAIGRF